MPRLFQTAALISALVLSSGALLAQERSFNFSLRGGAALVPEYPGSDDYEVAPDLGFRFGAFNWGRVNIGNGIGNIPDNGFAVGGAFRVIGSRDAADNPELAGLEDIDTTVELGIGVAYRQTNWLAFGEVRHGIGGHEGVTGTVGADVILRPTSRLTVTAGPRLYLGNDEYAGTYFGITGTEAAASQFSQFNAEGGLLGAGFQVQGTYELDDKWSVEGLLSYERLQNDAADSPITQLGSEDQWRLSIGLSRAFNLRF